VNRTAWIALLLLAALLALYFVPRDTTGPDSVLAAAEFIVFGLAVGAYGTLVGAGGGFLIVPALLIVYHAHPAQAAGTSLTVVFLNAVSGTLSYARQRRIDYRTGAAFALATLPGAVGGAFLSRYFSGHTFSMGFGMVLLGIAAVLVWRPTAQREIAEALIEEAETNRWEQVRRITDAAGQVHVYRYNWVLGVMLSFFVGFLSSILGIGGGIIHVPAMIHFLGFPAHVATATSHFILAITAAAGAGTHIGLGHVLAGPAILMGIGVIGGAQIGAVLAQRMKGSRIIRLLSLALVIVALRLLIE